MHRFIKAVGAGAKRARDLSRDEACEAMGLVLDQRAEPVQVGAFLIALRMKGEVASELAGFVDALAARARQAVSPPGTLDVDGHGDGHVGRVSRLPEAALRAAALGVPVLLRCDLANPFAKHGLPDAIRALGLPVAADPGEAARLLTERRVAVLDLPAYAAPLKRLVDLRPLLGVRTVAQTLMKLLDPLGATARLVGVFHAPYLPSTAAALAALGRAPGLCVQALGGLPEASPGKLLRVASSSDPTPRTLDLRALEDPVATATALLIHAARGTPIDEAYAEARRVG